MTARVRRLLVLLGVMGPLLAAPVEAQEIAASFGELKGLVKTGETIYVTDKRGATIKGELTGLSAASVEIRRDGGAPVTVSERDVNNIAVQRVDPRWNGMLIGFAAAGIPVALIGVGSSAPGGEVAAVAGGYGVIGLLTGLLIDTLNKEKATIYVQAPGSDVRVSPFLSKSAAGVQVSIRF